MKQYRIKGVLLLLRIQCLVLIFFLSVHVKGSDFPFWDNCISLLKGNLSPGSASCSKTIPNKPVEMFSSSLNKKLVAACVLETCGKVEPDMTNFINGMVGEETFINKYKNEIASASRNVSKNESLWLRSQIQELNKERPFSTLSAEEKVLASIGFLSNRDPNVLSSLSPHESEKLAEKLKKTDAFNEQYSSTYERNLKYASAKSISQIRTEMKTLNASLKAKYEGQRIWSDLQDITLQNETAFKLEAAAQSDYYKNNALEQYAYARTLSEALNNKEAWNKKIVDLGNPGKDFPSLIKAFNEHSSNLEPRVKSAFQKCARKVGERLAYLPSEQKLQEIKSTIEFTKKEIDRNFLTKLSEHSRKVLKEILSKTVINLPPSKESYEAAFREKLNLLSTNAVNAEAIRVAGIYDFRNAQSYEKYMAEECEYGILREGEDHAIPGFEKINLSEIVSHNDVAVGLVAHELFHLFDPSISLEKMSDQSAKEIVKIKECLAGFHKGNSFYLTEDWADAGSAFISSNLKTNRWCREAFNSEIISSKNDNHSPVLFRLLHHQIYKKEGLSSSCKKIIETHTPLIPLKKCL